MSIVSDLKAQIRKLHDQIEEIQEQCSHPKSCVTRVGKSNTGNYDPSEDSYWYECNCALCQKRWTEPQ